MSPRKVLSNLKGAIRVALEYFLLIMVGLVLYYYFLL